MTFDCESDVMAWMVSNQTGRRHFSPMENIGILEKVREKRKEEARIRQLSGLKHSKVIVASNLTQREKPTDSNRLDESIRPQKGFLMDAEDILRMTPEQLDSEFYP